MAACLTFIFIFHVDPQILDWIEVGNVSEPLAQLHPIFYEKALSDFGTVARCAVLRQYLTILNMHMKF